MIVNITIVEGSVKLTILSLAGITLALTPDRAVLFPQLLYDTV